MPAYRVHYADASGSRLNRLVHAESRHAAGGLIPLENTILLSVDEVTEKPGGFSYSQAPSPSFVLELTQTLALLSRSGLDIQESLEITRTLFPFTRGFRGRKGRVVADLAESLKRGDSFSTATGELRFPSIYTGLIKIGEKVGSMALILPAMADYLKNRKEMRDKFINAMLYPSLVLTAVIIGALVLMIVVAPKTGEILSGFGTSHEATAAMEIRMRISSLVAGISGGAVLLSIIATAFLRRGSRSFRLATDRMLLKLPLIGRFASLQDTVNLVFALEVLTASGVSLEDAFYQAAAVSANQALAEGLLSARQHIIQGARPSRACAAAGVFPDRLIRWLALGERTGKVDEVFSGLKIWYQGEFETFLTRMTGLAEPALIILTGILLLGGVVIFVLPLLSGFGNLF